MSTTIGPFELQHLLGVGGMGHVWRGAHRGQGVGVAIKVLTAENARRATFRRLFHEEVRAVAGLHHPGIVLVLDVGEIDAAAEAASDGQLVAGSPWLAMELASGGTIEDAPPGSWEEVQALLLGILDALAHAHARGVLHRDLKPANVLRCLPGDPRPGLKLSDFGLAWARDAEAPEGAAVCGTPRYMAPEQFRGDGRAFGPWTDLYALGCMAWELTTGKPPFGDGDLVAMARAHLRAPLPAFEPVMEVPDGLSGWLFAMLEKPIGARAQRAADTAWALQRLGAASSGRAAPAVALGSLVTLAPVSLFAAAAPSVPTSGGAFSLADVTQVGDGAPVPPVEPEVTSLPPEALPAFPVPPPPPDWRAAAPPASMRLVGAGLGLFGLREIAVVDREADRDALWEALRGAIEGRRPRVVVLRGASGVGVSRLAAWLCERSDELGIAEALRASHQPFGGPRDGVAAAIARHLRLGGLSPEGVRSRLDARLRELGGDLEEDAPALAAALDAGGPPPASAGDRWGPLGRYLRLLARRRPVVLWLDDVAWGADALGFVRWLLRDPDGLPLLVVATARDEALVERPAEARLIDGLGAAGASVRDVPPLAQADAVTLIGDLVGLEGALAQRVARRSAGVPTFAVQLIRDWVQRGVLVPGPDGFRLRRGERADIPDDVHALWRERLSGAIGAAGGGDDAWRALELAAVLGGDVEADVWREACSAAGVAVPDRLVDVLLERRLAQGLDSGWSFAHGLLRESLLRAAREDGREAGWHGACAGALAATGRADGPTLGRIGHHLLAAGRLEEAIAPLLDGAVATERHGLLVDALRLLEHAEGALQRAGVSEDDRRWATLWSTRGQVLTAQGRGHDGRADAIRLERLAERKGWGAMRHRAVVLLATASMVVGDFAAAEEAARRALALPPEPGAERLRRTSLNTLGDIARMRGDLDAAAVRYEEAASLPGLDEVGSFAPRLGLAFVRGQRHRFDEARRGFQEVLERAQSVGQRFTRAVALNGLGELSRAEGDLAAAEGYYRAAVAVARPLGPERGTAPRMNLGLVLAMRGRHAEADRVLAAERSRLDEAGRKALAAACSALLATGAAAAGERETFDRHLAAVIGYRVASGGWVEKDVIWALERAAELWEAAGEAGRARSARAEAARMTR